MGMMVRSQDPHFILELCAGPRQHDSHVWQWRILRKRSRETLEWAQCQTAMPPESLAQAQANYDHYWKRR